ncbi:MAG: tyrosine/phenylalanine carboxypeptidase domain-containing protein, partial [Myxococcota bacterium]
NARAQPIRLLELGTAGSFRDQEGLAIWLEESAGVLDGRRLRTLAARVIAADRMHGGQRFGETARDLMRLHGFPAEDALALAERAHRGGGLARDVSYLAGWLRVRHAIDRGEATVDELRSGRVGLDELPALRRLRDLGWIRPAVYRPSLSRSLRATHSGTSLSTSPPSAATSLTRFEAT